MQTMLHRLVHGEGQGLMVHEGDELPALQQKPEMPCSQNKSQELLVKCTVFLLTVTEVFAEKGQWLLRTIHPLLTHHPNSQNRGISDKSYWSIH